MRFDPRRMPAFNIEFARDFSHVGVWQGCRERCRDGVMYVQGELFAPQKDPNYRFFERLLPPNKLWYTVKEAAAVLGRSDQYIRDCFDNQKILGHIWNGKAARGKEQRRSYHIPRESLILFLMETANYQAGDFIERFERARRR